MRMAWRRLVLPVAMYALVVVLAVTLAVVATLCSLAATAMVAVAALAVLWVALFASTPRSYIVFAKRTAVTEDVRNTLRLLQLEFGECDHRFTVIKTGTSITILPLWPLSCISFGFAEGGSAREQYLAATIIKYQRYVAP